MALDLSTATGIGAALGVRVCALDTLSCKWPQQRLRRSSRPSTQASVRRLKLASAQADEAPQGTHSLLHNVLPIQRIARVQANASSAYCPTLVNPIKHPIRQGARARLAVGRLGAHGVQVHVHRLLRVAVVQPQQLRDDQLRDLRHQLRARGRARARASAFQTVPCAHFSGAARPGPQCARHHKGAPTSQHQQGFGGGQRRSMRDRQQARQPPRVVRQRCATPWLHEAVRRPRSTDPPCNSGETTNCAV